MKRPLLIPLAVLLLVGAGCKPHVRDVSSLERKQAANLASEAQFALSLRDYARAEPLLAKAADLAPDDPGHWIALGSTRVRLADKGGAKKAYEGALTAFKAAFAKDGKSPEPLLQEVYVLALLGRLDDARDTLATAQKKFPQDRTVRTFVEGKQLDRILEDPGFKAIAL